MPSTSQCRTALRVAAALVMISTLAIFYEFNEAREAPALSKRQLQFQPPPSRCVVLEREAMSYTGGYGDYVRLIHRPHLVAQSLGCEYIPRFSSIGLKTQPAGTIESKSMSIELDNVVACDADDVVDTKALLSSTNTSCDISLPSPRQGCNVITYKPERLEYLTPKLHCIKDSIRQNWRHEVKRPVSGCERYAGIHYRWGDVAGLGEDNWRITKPWEVSSASSTAHTLLT